MKETPLTDFERHFEQALTLVGSQSSALQLEYAGFHACMAFEALIAAGRHSLDPDWQNKAFANLGSLFYALRVDKFLNRVHSWRNRFIHRYNPAPTSTAGSGALLEFVRWSVASSATEDSMYMRDILRSDLKDVIRALQDAKLSIGLSGPRHG